MKKIYFLIIYLLCANVHSQNVVSDFTVTDIKGNSHTLSNYLSEGKQVVLHFFSIGCHASWTEKLNGYYEDRYIAYGPLGSNEMMILFVEDNPVNTLEEVNGVNQTGFGDWTKGVSYPIIVGSNLGSLYNVTYEPTSRQICTNATFNNCSNLNGVQNFVKILETDTGFCSDEGSFIAKVKNYGNNNVSNLKMNLKENGVVIKSKLFTGNISQFSTEEISFEPIKINKSSEYSVELISVNNKSNHNADFSKAKMNFHFSKPISEKLKIKIHTYICPQKMKCNILDSENNIIQSFGPYGDDVPQGMCGGSYSNSIIEQEFNLPDINECYSIQLLSLGSIGWKNLGYNYVYQGNVTPGIEVYSDDELIFSKLSVGSFGRELVFTNLFNKIVEEQTYSNNDELINIYPNPVLDILNLYTKGDNKILGVSIYNILGQLVLVAPNTQNIKIVDVSNLSSGNYFIKINSDKGTSNTKFIKQ